MDLNTHSCSTNMCVYLAGTRTGRHVIMMHYGNGDMENRIWSLATVVSLATFTCTRLKFLCVLVLALRFL